MPEVTSLTLAFVSGHPGEAARVLEGLPAPEVSALLAGLPSRVAAPVMTAMLPTTSARVLGVLDDPSALELLAASGVQSAVSILRYVAEPRRSDLIAALPTATATASRLLLGYSDDSVGAWADPDALALPADVTAGEAIARIRNDRHMDANLVHVVTADQQLLGQVSLTNLLRAQESSVLTVLMTPARDVLPGAMPVSGAETHSGWKRSSVLPVVERGDRLIGVLHAGRLAEALLFLRGRSRGAGDEQLVEMVGRHYWDTVSGLLQLFLGLLPSPARREEPK